MTKRLVYIGRLVLVVFGLAVLLLYRVAPSLVVSDKFNECPVIVWKESASTGQVLAA